MLKEYQITNFKAFAGPANLPIKPITLIFGANSSGKSCILQSLLMFKQTLQERRDPNISLLPKGNFVDLGSFREFIFDHDINRSFSFKMMLPFSSIDEGYWDSEYFYQMDTQGQHPNVKKLEESVNSGPVGLSLTFSLDSKSSNIFVSKINLYLGDDPKPIATYEIEEKDDQVSNIYNFKGNFDHKYWFTYWKCFDEGNPEGIEESYINREITKMSTEPGWDKVDFGKWSYKDKKRLIKKIQELLQKYSKEEKSLPQKQDEKKEGKKKRKSKEGLKKVTGFEKAIEIYENVFSRITLSVEGFLPNLLREIEMKYFLWNYDFAYWDSRNVSLFALTAANLIKVFLDNIEYIAPLREYPERFYTYGGHPLQYVGSSGEKVFDVLFNNSELLAKVNEGFKRFGADYELRLSRLSREGTEISESFVPELVNKSTGVAASFRDVGFGFSQVLPVIVQSTLSKKQS